MSVRKRTWTILGGGVALALTATALWQPLTSWLVPTPVLWLAKALWPATTPVSAKVGEFTGGDYLTECTSADPDWKLRNKAEQDMAVHCVGYIEASVTFIAMMDGRSFCLPPGTTPQDVLKATVAFMQARPDQKQYLLASVMVAAAQAQWPCRPK